MCVDPTHQEVARKYFLRGQSRFLLRERLQRARMASAQDSMPPALEDGSDEPEEEVFEVDEEGNVVSSGEPPEACPDKPETGNRRIRAQFGRKRTHNEQIIVAPCGVIIARTTFFGAEAVSSVVVRGIVLVIY